MIHDTTDDRNRIKKQRLYNSEAKCSDMFLYNIHSLQFTVCSLQFTVSCQKWVNTPPPLSDWLSVVHAVHGLQGGLHWVGQEHRHVVPPAELSANQCLEDYTLHRRIPN